jgi:alpha-tubulin suppressor-like RCC1 family protein
LVLPPSHHPAASGHGATNATRPAWAESPLTTGRWPSTQTSLFFLLLTFFLSSFLYFFLSFFYLKKSKKTSPADTPNPVTDLDDLPTGPIVKLAAGGYLLAALTAGHDLYCWGDAGRSRVLADLSDTPSPVVIYNDNNNDNNSNDNDDTGNNDDNDDNQQQEEEEEQEQQEREEEDVIDVAIGEAHMLALTAAGRVYVVGDNGNGQLGLPGRASAWSWTRVDLGAESGQVIGVAAGPRNSFLVVRNT